ncbi:MAG: TetR/AcrR family transcriptional regulator [Thermodesulfobacteriota bacterium]
MKEKATTGKRGKPANIPVVNRGAETRGMILAAARQVFAAHSYNAASVRMIAARGDFYHGLIRYHFPSKAGIFEAVVEDACRSLYEANKQWLLEIATFSPEKALSTYLDRFIEFFRKQPDVFRIIIRNFTHDDPANLPGFRHLATMLADTRRDFEATFPGLFVKGDVGRFLSSLNALILHYLGAGSIESLMVGFRGPGKAYLEWVKETLFFIFLPVLEAAARESAISKPPG